MIKNRSSDTIIVALVAFNHLLISTQNDCSRPERTGDSVSQGEGIRLSGEIARCIQSII